MKREDLKDVYILEDQKNGVFVLAKFKKNGKFVILKTSIARLVDVKEKLKWNLKLCKDSCIRLKNENFLFIKSFTFDTIERATSILYGKEYNFSNKGAKKVWKTQKSSFLGVHNNDTLVLINTKKRILAWGKLNKKTNNFEVLENSMGTLSITRSGDTQSYRKLLEKLQKNYTITIIKELKVYLFNKNYSFDSIEDATMFLEGSRKDSRRMKKWIWLSNWKEKFNNYNSTLNDKKIVFVLDDYEKRIFAWGSRDETHFVIKKKSRGYLNRQMLIENSYYKNKINKLLKSKVITMYEDKNHFIFKNNYIFENIENATFFILGNMNDKSNASKMWINTKTRESYFDLFVKKQDNKKNDSDTFILNRFNRKVIKNT